MLSTEYLRIFQKSFCYFQFNSIVVKECTVYDFNAFKFIEMCSLVQHMVGLNEYSHVTLKAICILLMGMSYKCHLA